MDIEKLLRDVEKRLAGHGADLVAEVQDALRETFARDRRRLRCSCCHDQ